MPKPENVIPHKFPKGKSGNPKGRPPKVVSQLVKDLAAEGYERIKPMSVIDVIETLLALPIEKIKELASDNDQPAYVRIVAKAVLSPKGTEVIEKLLDRAHGRARQSVEVTGDADKPLQVNATGPWFLQAAKQEYEKRLKELGDTGEEI